MRASLSRRWDKFWFSETAPVQLGLTRLGFFGSLFVLAVREPYAAAIAIQAHSFWRPVWVIGVLGDPPGLATLRILQVTWCVALATSAVGLATRASTALAALLSLYFIGLQNSFGTVSHGRSPMVLAGLVLALAACGDGLSLDAWLRRRPTPAPAARYGWPLQLVRTIWCVVFLSAGISKLSKGGAAWVFSENMATMLLVAPHRYGEAAAASLVPSLGTWIGLHAVLCQLLAAVALSLELAAPLALFSRGRVVVLLMAGLQVGIALTMFENFVWFVPLYFAWLPQWPRARMTSVTAVGTGS